MGKMSKKSRRSGDQKPSRNIPLAEQLLEDTAVRPPGREKKRNRKDDDVQVNTKLSLIHMGRQNQLERSKVCL